MDDPVHTGPQPPNAKRRRARREPRVARERRPGAEEVDRVGQVAHGDGEVLPVAREAQDPIRAGGRRRAESSCSEATAITVPAGESNVAAAECGICGDPPTTSTASWSLVLVRDQQPVRLHTLRRAARSIPRRSRRRVPRHGSDPVEDQGAPSAKERRRGIGARSEGARRSGVSHARARCPTAPPRGVAFPGAALVGSVRPLPWAA